MTMWTLQQFVDATDSYGLRLVRIQAPPPAAIVSVSPATLANGLTGATAHVTGVSMRPAAAASSIPAPASRVGSPRRSAASG